MSATAYTLRGAPPLLVAAALLLWGWQNAFLPYAVPMALMLEAARWSRWRWPVSAREFNLVADLCSAALLLIVLWVFSAHGAKGIFTILALLPFAVFPLLLVQNYSERGRIRLSALFISLRRLDPAATPEAAQEIDLGLPYFLLCLISASAGNRAPLAFFIVAALLLALLLWSVRPRRYPPAAWAALLLLALALAWSAQSAMVRLQYAVEASVLQVFDRFLWRYRDPHQATTAIGTIGRVKLSDRIVLRVKTAAPLRAPLLLREASYDAFRYGVWSARRREFTPIDAEISGTEWTLRPGNAPERAAISMYMMETSGVIPLPHATGKIVEVGATELQRNAYGTVEMEIREGWIRYTALYGAQQAAADPPPTANDLEISDTLSADFSALAESLQLAGRSHAEIIDAVRRHFADGFSYSLTQRQRYPRDRYLADFLFNSRSGHCEYFATATVLLLRAAGVPARYAVGYAVDEYSRLEGQYVARARHAHSWALAWLDGRWIVVDTTPPGWAPLEQDQASLFEPLFDLRAWLGYRLSRWQTADELEEDSGPPRALLWLLLPLVGTLLWRLLTKERIARTAAAPTRTRATVPGLDSSLYRLVRELELRGHLRQPGETLAAWLGRDAVHAGLPPLDDALQLHYRCRFDPRGLDAAGKQALETAVRAALRALAAARPAT